MIKEDLLHFVWKYGLFNQQQLETTSGEEIQILDMGEHNHNAGPDFLSSKIKIGDTTWAGNVELHVRNMDWFHHKHQTDKAYNNVILHVVHTADEKDIITENGNVLPVLELKNRLASKVLENYDRLALSKDWIPCEQLIAKVDPLTLRSTMDGMILQRLERKTNILKQLLESSNYDWEESYYQFLAKAFGMKVNQQAFEHLARVTALKTLSKHKNNPIHLEALLMGQAGFLDRRFRDDYPKKLKSEYQYLKKMYRLQQVPLQLWKFHRLRPPNFPTIRIAQFAAMIHHSNHLFSRTLECKNITEFRSLFSSVASSYWDNHYVFDEAVDVQRKRLGKATVNLILINVVVPFLFLYGKYKAEEAFVDKSLGILERLSAERNQIISKWEKLGIKVDNSFDSQALIELRNESCVKFKCLECKIGLKVLRS